MKPFDFFTKKEKVDNIGYVTTDNYISRMHHSIKADFSNVLLNLTYNGEELKDFMKIYQDTYNIYVNIPNELTSKILNVNTSLQDIMVFFNSLMTFKIKGIVIELGEYTTSVSIANINFEIAFLNRFIPIALRNNIKIYISNGLKKHVKGYTLSDIIKLCRNKNLEIGLNLFNTHKTDSLLSEFLLKKENQYGFTKDFTLTILSGINRNSEEVNAGKELNTITDNSKEDIYSISDYKLYIKNLRKNTLIFIKGDIKEACMLKTRLKEK